MRSTNEETRWRASNRPKLDERAEDETCSRSGELEETSEKKVGSRGTRQGETDEKVADVKPPVRGAAG